MVHRKRLVTPCFRYTKPRASDEGKTSEHAPLSRAFVANFSLPSFTVFFRLWGTEGAFAKVRDWRIVSIAGRRGLLQLMVLLRDTIRRFTTPFLGNVIGATFGRAWWGEIGRISGGGGRPTVALRRPVDFRPAVAPRIR